MEANQAPVTVTQKWYQRVDWPVTSFLILLPIIALVLTPLYYVYSDFSWGLVIFAIIFAAATNLSITAGYHRLFSHRSYEAHPLVRAIFLLIGASAWQGSALKWSADHRRHHGKVDSDEDPYSINKGFWYAHMGWLFMKDSTDKDPKAPDLEKDWMVKYQHKYYYPLAFFMSFGFPTLVGWSMGSAWGGFVIAGVLRVVLTQQSTFFVNSLCHTLGKQTYSDQVSARDSFIVAILTHGEGYHNFHHHFQLDYRNGIRWYQWDPTKWIIRSLAFMGLAKKLKRISQAEILKAKLQMDEMRLRSKGYSDEKISQLKDQIINAQIALQKFKADYQLMKSEMQEASEEKMRQLKLDIEFMKIELRYSMKMWQMHLQAATI